MICKCQKVSFDSSFGGLSKYPTQTGTLKQRYGLDGETLEERRKDLNQLSRFSNSTPPDDHKKVAAERGRGRWVQRIKSELWALSLSPVP